jgi:hypothetical protein
VDAEQFIGRWTAREGGAERANYQMFLSELCDVIGVTRPQPAGAARGQNDYVFERAVRPRESDGGTAPKRIDLYKRGAFILEAKQSRLPGAKNALPGQPAVAEEPQPLGRRSIARGWDVMMQNARQQRRPMCFCSTPTMRRRPSSSPATSATPSRSSPTSPARDAPIRSFPTATGFASISRICAARRRESCWRASGPIRSGSIPAASRRG